MWKFVASLTLLAGCNCNQDELYDAIKEKVSAELLSPASAVFPDVEKVVRMSNSSGEHCMLMVDGYVDSQNGFGAMLRTHYGSTTTKDGKGIHVGLVMNP